MSVSTTGVAQSYAGDGSTSIFDYPNYVFEPADLVVTVTVSGVTTSYALNAKPGFTFSGTADTYGAYPTGGNVALVDANGNPAPPAAGSTVLITRVTPRTQAMSFLDNDPLPATVLEHGLDKLTLIAQESTLFLGLSAAPSAAGSQVGQWWQNAAPTPGGNFGWVWTGTAWQQFGQVSL